MSPTAGELDLLDTEIETDLRATVAGLLTARCDPHRVRAAYDGDASLGAELWPALARDVGVAGLLVPEDAGGAGASAREAAVVMEEIGRHAAPAPFLTSAVVATSVLLAGATDATRELVAGLAAGERTAAVVVPFSAGAWTPVDRLGAAPGATVRSVAGALEADVLLVPVRVGDGLEVRAVPAHGCRTVVSLDMARPLADVTLEEAVLADGTVVVPAGAGAEAVRRALLLGAAMLAAEQVGTAQWCLATTTAYLKERRQFGRVVGGFQALKHRLADLYAAVESGTAAARAAAAAHAAGVDAEVATAVAAAYCGDLAVRAAEEAIQLHGGIGMTWEHPAHLHLKRAKADQIALGSPGAHRTALARLVDLTL